MTILAKQILVALGLFAIRQEIHLVIARIRHLEIPTRAAQVNDKFQHNINLVNPEKKDPKFLWLISKFSNF